MKIYNINNIKDIPKGSYAVIGYPIEHTLSPQIHNALTCSEEYYCIRIRPEELEYAVPLLRETLKGFNCTIPHKLQIMRYLDYIDESATEYGAVNTVKVESGKLYGYNTDGKGFLSAIDRIGLDLTGKNVLLYGAGGVARVMAFESVKSNARLTIYNRDKIRAQELMDIIKIRYPDSVVDIIDRVESNRWDYLLNATPKGMYPLLDDMPLDYMTVREFKGIYDTIYNPFETKLLRVARENSIVSDNGLYMLIMQAIYARVLWEGYESKDKAIYEIYNQLKTVLTS